MLDLEGEQRLVELARECLLRREKEVARHLHGDGARALTAAAGDQVGVRGTQDTDVIDARMLIEALVFRGDDRVLELRWHFADRDDGAALLAEFADQRALGAIDAKRDFRLVGRQRAELGQVRVGEHDQQPENQDCARDRARQQGQRQAKKTKPHWDLDRARAQLPALDGSTHHTSLTLAHH